jgi:hypothetical protein
MNKLVYINVAVINNVNEILENLLTRINTSGLYLEANRINLVINGDISQLNETLLRDKYSIYYPNKDTTKCEFPILEMIWQDSKNSVEDFYVLYLHTKGVSFPNSQPVIDWTNYLSYFNIDKWKDRIIDLSVHDCSGVNLAGNPADIKEHPSTWGHNSIPLHYSGNFWWSKASHIKKLPNPVDWVPDDNYIKWRHMAEMWVCQIEEASYANAWQSNVNHYFTEYPSNFYTN